MQTRTLWTAVIFPRLLIVWVVATLLCLAPSRSTAQMALTPQWVYSPITFVQAAVYSPDGSILAISGTYAVQIYDASTHKLLRCIPNTGGASDLIFSPDGKTLAGSLGPTVQLWNVATGNLTETFSLYSGTISSIAFSPDGANLAACTETQFNIYGYTTGVITLWNLSSGVIQASSNPVFGGFTGIAYSPDGTKIAACTTGETPGLQFFDASTLSSVSVLSTNAAPVYAVAYSPDGTLLADVGARYDSTRGAYTGVVELWNVATGTLKASLPTAAGIVNSVQFSPDGKTLADGTTSNSSGVGDIELWNVANGLLITTLVSSSGDNVRSIDFSPDGKSLAACGEAFSSAGYSLYSDVDLWNVSPGTQIATILPELYNSASCLALSPDGTGIALGGTIFDYVGLQTKNWIGLWNASTGELNSSFTPSGTVYSVAFSQNGTMLVDGGYQTSGGLLELWNLAAGRLVQSFPTAASKVASVAYSSDGTIIAAGGTLNVGGTQNGVLELWNAATGKLVRTLPTNIGGGVVSIALSPNGKMLAACGFTYSPLGFDYGVVEIWNVSTGTLIHSLDTSILYPNSVAFSPDGKSLADGGSKFTPVFDQFGFGLELWDIQSGNRLSSFPSATGTGGAGTVAFSPDGTMLFASANNDLQAFSLVNLNLMGAFPSSSLVSLAVSPSGGQLISLSTNGQLETASNPFYFPDPISSLTFNPSTVMGGGKATGTVKLSKAAPPAGLDVVFTSSNANATVPGVITVPAGATSATFSVSASAVSAQSTVGITARNGNSSKTATLTIAAPSVLNVQLYPGSLIGGQTCTGMVVLSGQAPTGGIKVNLSSSQSAATLPTSVTILAGDNAVEFSVATVPVAVQKSAKLTAIFGGKAVSSTLIVNPPSLTALALNPTSVSGGSSSTATVTIGSAAPAGGLVISLSSSSGSAVVPKTVAIPAGLTSATFSVKTKPVKSSTSATIKATLAGATQAASLTIS